MTRVVPIPTAKMDPIKEEITDGRRQRSHESKQRIVAAMLQLVREGRIAPTAEEVAQRADVGLRTVFRRFKDMESLYAEMSVAISAEIEPIIGEPPLFSDWALNFAELVDRRLKVYEVIAPYRVAADVHRFQSNILLSHHLDIVNAEREKLQSVLPAEMQQDETLLEALEAVLSFDMWNQLRKDQTLSASDATAVVYRIVSSLLPEGNIEHKADSRS